MTTDQQNVARDGATIEDIDSITQAVQLYIDGVARGDQAKLADAFHPDARMYGAVGDQRFDTAVAEFGEVVAASPGDGAGTFRARISSIVQAGDAASATVVEDGFWGTLSFVDFLSLCRIEGRWRIVAKAFTHTRGELPASH